MKALPLLALLASLAPQAVSQVPRTPVPGGPAVRPAPTPIRQICRDPAAASLTSMVTTNQGNAGVLLLQGNIVNRGNAAFVSPAAQARVQILEGRPQGGAPIVLLDQPLTNLQPGHGFLVTARRAFTRNQQFPPTFSLILSYDPDILQDGNPENDDCNSFNNRIDLAGSVIDHEWPRQVVQGPR